MNKFLFCLLTIILLASCSKKKTLFTEYLTPGYLPTQTFIINTLKDTAITTKNGSKITIPANSISAEQNQVALQVKEALSIDDMISAGLFTESNKGILSSSGMINITTKENSTISKAIQIAMPVQFTKAAMRLYKGEEKDGKIVWKDPQPVSTNNDATLSGEAIFKTNCSSCHAIAKDLTDPALANIDKKRSRKWLHAFTRNNQELIHSGDGYACCIYTTWNKTAMNLFPNLDDKELDAVYNT